MSADRPADGVAGRVQRLGRLREDERVQRLIPVLRVIGFAASLGIVAFVAVKAAGDLDPARLRWWALAPTVVLAAVWWLWLGAGWGLLASGRATRADLSLWCRTQAFRYLPGGFWGPASRMVAVRGRIFDRFATVATENFIALCAALALAGIALPLSGRPVWLPLVLAAALPVLAARFLAARTRVAPDRALRATAVNLLGFAAYAGAAVFAQAAVSGFDEIAAVAGAALAAWGIGLVVVIAPGGVGVREAAYVALLAGTIGAGPAAAAALVLRTATVVAELVVLVAAGRPADDGAQHVGEPATAAE